MWTNIFRNLWLSLFGTTEWMGLDMGFWVSMGFTCLIVVLMHVIFWPMKPKVLPKAAPEEDED